MKINIEVTAKGLEEVLRFLHGDNNKDITFPHTPILSDYFKLDSAAPIRATDPSRTTGYEIEVSLGRRPVPSGVYNKLTALLREYSPEVEPKDSTRKFGDISQ